MGRVGWLCLLLILAQGCHSSTIHPNCQSIYSHYVAVAVLGSLNLLAAVLLILKLSCRFQCKKTARPATNQVIYYTPEGVQHTYECVKEVQNCNTAEEFQGYEVPNHVLDKLEK